MNGDVVDLRVFDALKSGDIASYQRALILTHCDRWYQSAWCRHGGHRGRRHRRLLFLRFVVRIENVADMQGHPYRQVFDPAS